MKFCKLDIKKATVNTVLQQAIYEAIVSKTTGRYKYEIIDDNYTIKITGKRSTNPKSPYKIADELVSRINSYKPDILRVVKTREDDQSPILLEVYVNPDYINQKFDSLPEEQKNHVNVDLSRDINFFNGDNSLMEQERKWDSDDELQFQKFTSQPNGSVEQFKNWVDSRNNPSNSDSLFGLNTQNQEQLEFHVNTLNVVSQFLENIGVEQRLVTNFLSQDGNVVEGAIAAANFIEGTVDIINDLKKGRAEAWNKLPEEAAHWWYRLLDTNSPLKKALWESHQTALKNDELYAGQYGKLVKSPSDLTEESIGQLIAEAIKRIETKNASASDYSFFKKFLEWINSIIDVFKDTAQDPFEVAAMKILSSDMSDLMTWEEYRKLNNIVNFADVLTEQSVAPLDYTIIKDIGVVQYPQKAVNNFIYNGDKYTIDTDNLYYFKNNNEIFREEYLNAYNNRNLDIFAFIPKIGNASPEFNTKEELDNWVYKTYGEEYDERQRQILQEVRDNQIFFDRLLNKTFRKKSKFLPKTLRKYYDIVDAQNLNPLGEWNISQELQQITKKLSEQEKKQIVETNGYTNIAPTLKVLPDLLKKYRKNPIVLSETIKIDGAKKQELSILNGIKEMIKLENPNLKSITAEEFVNEAHNWLQTNYLLGFANETGYNGEISSGHPGYNIPSTFTHYDKNRDISEKELEEYRNLTEEQVRNLSFPERQRYLDIAGLGNRKYDIYHNKISISFNDTQHLNYHSRSQLRHFKKFQDSLIPSAWGNLTYFYTGKNKWKDAVLLHEIQNDNIEALREFKAEKVDLETSLGRYLQQLNIDLLDNITQIESGNKKIVRKDSSIENQKTHVQLNYQLQQLKDLPLEQGLQQLKQKLSELIELYKSDSSKDVNRAQEAVDRAYSQRRKFQDFQRRGGIKSLLTKEELDNLSEILNRLNTEEVMTAAVYMPEENQYEPGYPTIRNLKEKKQEFKRLVNSLETKINNKLKELYGNDAPVITLQAPAKPLPKSQRNMRTVGFGANQRRIGGASQELNENVNFLIAYSEKQISTQLSKNIEDNKRKYISARNATVDNNFNVALSKITPEQYATLIENYKYNKDLLNRLIDEQALKDIKLKSSEINPEDNPLISKEFYKTITFSQLPSDAEVNTSVNFGTWEFGYGTIWTSKKFPDNYYIEVDNSNVGVIKKDDLKQSIINSNKKENKVIFEKNKFETLKQKALDKKAELEKNYGKIEEEVKQTLEIEMNYFTPLVHHLIQKHINQYGKDFPMYFSGYQITKLTQGNDRTALIYAGKDEINIVDKNSFKVNDKKYQRLGEGAIINADSKEELRYFKLRDEYKLEDINGIRNITEQEYNKALQEYEKAYQQATERRAKEIKFEAARQIGLINTQKDIDALKEELKTGEQQLLLEGKSFAKSYFNMNMFNNLSSEEQKEKIEKGKKDLKYRIEALKEKINNPIVDLEEGIKKLNEYKKQSKQNMDRVIKTIMNISNSKPIETGAIYNAMSQISGVKLIWQDKIDGLKGNTGGYLVDLSNYNYNTPILYGLQNNKLQEDNSFQQFQQSLNTPNTNPILQGNQKPDVILPIGTSGSGKSTFIKSLPQENLVVIEPDAMRVEFTGDMNNKSKDKEIYEEAAKRAIAAIKQGKQVVFDTTNLTKDKRLPFIEAIKKAIPDANIQYKLMELNPELAKQRIKADIAAGKNRANVPDATIDRHAESYKQMLEDIKSEPISNFDVQQEQAKKFTELQERLNNKEFLEGAKNAFESSEELQNVYYDSLDEDKFEKIFNNLFINKIIEKKC